MRTNQAIDFLLPTARKIRLKSFVGNQGIPDIGFEFSIDEKNWQRVGTQLGVTENAVSDSNGELRAIVPRDAFAIRVAKGHVGHEPAEPIQRVADDEVGDKLLFEFRKQEEGTQISIRRKAHFGRYEYRKNNHHRPDISKEEFFKQIRSLRDKPLDEVVNALNDLLDKPRMVRCVLTQLGERRRCEVDYTDSDGYESLNICDGEHSIFYMVDSGQCDVYRTDNCNRGFDSVYGLINTLDKLPEIEPTSSGNRLLYEMSKTHKQDVGGEIKEIKERGRIEIDKDTNFLFERISSYGPNGRALWQFCPKEFDGVLFAQAIVETTFRDQKLDRVEFTVIDDVTLTENISASAFAMQVAAGTTVVDQRSRQRNGFGSRSPAFRQNYSTFDLIGLMNPPKLIRKSSLAFGDQAPELQIKHWAKQGRPIETPDLSGKFVVLCMMDSPISDDLDELPNIRRAAETISKFDDVEMVVLLTDDFSKVDLAKFSIVRRMPCYVAVDGREAQQGRRRRTNTATAFGSDVLSATAIIDDNGKVNFLASYVGHVDAAVERIVRIKKARKAE